MPIRAGTSGFAYSSWKGSFYPDKLPGDRMLQHYAGRLPTVEINNTFYRMPSAKLIDRWIAAVPDEFSFVLKATRRLTHFAKLGDVDEILQYLLRTIEPLGDRLGAHLFQLPPYLRADPQLLDEFLDRVPTEQRAAVEFRHDSWFTDPVFDVLRRHDAALVLVDGGKIDVPVVSTASWGYLRLRRDDYVDADLKEWADILSRQGWEDAFVFFKHEEAGAAPLMAARFLEVVG